VAYDGYFPPYSYLTDDGKFQGLAVDVTNRIAAELGITLRVYTPNGLWKDLYAAAKRREVDVVATMVDRPERREWFLFTQPYIFKSLVVMTRKDDTRITRREDIAGKTVALVRGYQYVKRIMKEFPTLKPSFADTMLEGLNSVATGKADAAITFLGAGHYLVTKYGISNLKFAAVYDRDTSLESFAIRKDWPELASILDKALAALSEEGLPALGQKWNTDSTLLADLEHDILSPKNKIVLISLAVFFGLALTAVLIISGRNRSLRKEVGRKTAELRNELKKGKRTERELEKHRQDLGQMVEERTRELKEAQEALLNVLEDVRDAKADLEKANIKLKDLDRLKSMFITSMSHELRTPLNSIIGFTGILLQGLAGDLNDEQQDQLRRVSGAGKHLLALITDVIDISKIEAGKTEAHVTEFVLSDLLTEAASQLQDEIGRKGLDLQVKMADRVKMKIDRRRLLQCLLNLLSNAFKFTEKGSILLETAVTADTVEIRVKDTGIGIREEELPRLFQSFVRLDSHLRTTVPGTGLGLYLTRKITEEILGGSVFVESREGVGSTFGVRVPREMPK